MSSSTQTTVNLHRLTLEILNTNSLHFILISLLFLPVTISACITVQIYISGNHEIFDLCICNLLFLIKTIIISPSQNLLTIKTLITVLTFICFIIFPTIAGVSLITFNTNNIIHHKPITISSIVKSGLLYTIIIGSIKLIILLLAVPVFSITITEAITSLGFRFGVFFFPMFVNLIVSYVFAISIVFLTEIREPNTVFAIVFRTGFLIVPALSYSQSLFGWTANWILIMQFGTICLQSSLMILLYVVEMTVVYVQCEVANVGVVTSVEISGEYVKLVANDEDGEVDDELAEEEANGGFCNMLDLLTIVWVILLCVQFYYIFMLFKNTESEQ